MRHGGLCTWGIQTGPFAACKANFVPKIFRLPDLYTGESNSLLPQREGFIRPCLFLRRDDIWQTEERTNATWRTQWGAKIPGDNRRPRLSTS